MPAAVAERRICALVVDDSAVVRQVLTQILEAEGSVRVMAAVADPLLAIERMRREWPDVIVLDVEMPRMDGITFLRKLMSERPTPVVVCSTLTTRGAETTMQALAAGAISVVPKPRVGTKALLMQSSAELTRLVREAAGANRANLRGAPPASVALAKPGEHATHAMPETTDRIVAVGTSTGGTQALERVLSVLPPVTPGIVVVQHMPEKFTTAFAARLDSVCRVEVREACHGDRVLPGRAYIAPGGRHLVVRRSGAQYLLDVTDGPLVNHHRPSVDVLFRSVAEHVGRNAMGVLMTGMGDDGARGLLAMRSAGARTVAQDEASCVVFGMPREAIRMGAAQKVVPLDGIAGEMQGFWRT